MDKHEHGSILQYIVIPTLHHSLLTAADAVLKCRVVTRGRNWIADIIISCSSSLNLDSIGIKMTLRSVAAPTVPQICGNKSYLKCKMAVKASVHTLFTV